MQINPDRFLADLHKLRSFGAVGTACPHTSYICVSER